MMLVIFALVQPLQPTAVDPSFVALLEMAGAVDPDTEVGDRRDLAVVEPEAARVDLPIGQEPEDLAPEAVRADRRVGSDGGPVRAGAGQRVIRGAPGVDGRRTAGWEIDRGISGGRVGFDRTVARAAI
jgi:hypothetical protein